MMFRSRVALRNIIFTVTFDILIRTDSSFHDDIHNNQKYSWNHSFIIRTTLCVLLRRIMMRSGAPRWSYSTACSCQTAGATWTPQRSRLVFYCSECLNMSSSVSRIKAMIQHMTLGTVNIWLSAAFQCRSREFECFSDILSHMKHQLKLAGRLDGSRTNKHGGRDQNRGILDQPGQHKQLVP